MQVPEDTKRKKKSSFELLQSDIVNFYTQDGSNIDLENQSLGTKIPEIKETVM